MGGSLAELTIVLVPLSVLEKPLTCLWGASAKIILKV